MFTFFFMYKVNWVLAAMVIDITKALTLKILLLEQSRFWENSAYMEVSWLLDPVIFLYLSEDIV